MKLQIAPNNWSCMATSVAMALDTQTANVVRLCGHSGDGLPWPPPFDHIREGFHIHELIDVVWLYFSKTLTPFIRCPMVTPRDECPEQPATFTECDAETRFIKRMWSRTGILTGVVKSGCVEIGHAVAWDGHKIYDPRGYIYPFTARDKYGYEPDVFWMLGGPDGSASKILA